jgi:hypothetical protein
LALQGRLVQEESVVMLAPTVQTELTEPMEWTEALVRTLK